MIKALNILSICILVFAGFQTVSASNFLDYQGGFIMNDNLNIFGDLRVENNVLETWYELNSGMFVRFSDSTGSISANQILLGNDNGEFVVYDNNFLPDPLITLTADGLSSRYGITRGSTSLDSSGDLRQVLLETSSAFSNKNIQFENNGGGPFNWNTVPVTSLSSSGYTVANTSGDGGELTDLPWDVVINIPAEILNGDHFPPEPVYSVKSGDYALEQFSSGTKTLELDRDIVATPYHRHDWGDLVGNVPTYLIPTDMDSGASNSGGENNLITKTCSEGRALCWTSENDASNGSSFRVRCCSINPNQPW